MKQRTWIVSLATGQTLARSFSWHVKRTRSKGTYTVRVGVFLPGWAGLLDWNNRAATFKVR